MDSRYRAFSDRLLIIERLSYVLLVVPFLTDLLETGHFPVRARALVSEIVVCILILGFILLVRRARAELARLESLRASLLESLLHDLRTPMTTLHGVVPLLARSQLPLNKRRLLADLAKRASRREIEIVDGIEDLQRLESSEIVPALETVQPQDLVAAAVRDVEAKAWEASVQVVPEIGPVPPIRVEERLLRRVLINLIHNAIKYSPPQGQVLVVCRTEGNHLLICVQDQGPGIAREQQSRIFQKYYRVEGRGQSRVGGTGLGLYFSDLVVKAHGGSIEVSSEPGRGTQMSIQLPLPDPARPGLPPPPA